VRRLLGWDEENMIKLELYASRLGQHEMSVVWRVERATDHP
jgi:hypothetical protein